MAIKKRKIKLRKKPRQLTPDEALSRMADIVEHFQDVDMARQYISAFHKNMLARLQSIAAKAEKERNWKFMDGCYKQATELFVLASVLYEKFPAHTILSDGAFDALAQWLLKNKDDQDMEFWNWYNVTAMGLKAGSGYNVAAKEPIPQYVFLLTGEVIEEVDGKPTQDKTTKLRRKPKPNRKRGSGSEGTNAKRPVRRRPRRRKSD